jgi:hypothetical protein
MNNLEFFVIFALPLTIGYFKEYNKIQKNYNHKIGKGYAYIVIIPLVISYISFSSLSEVSNYLFGNNDTPRVLLFVGTSFTAGLLSKKVFNYRSSKIKFRKYSDSWFMNRFYSSLLYSMLIASPAFITFFPDLIQFFRVFF